MNEGQKMTEAAMVRLRVRLPKPHDARRVTYRRPSGQKEALMPTTKRAAVNGEGTAAAAISTLNLERIQDQLIEVPIVGITPVIPHKWTEKALRMMREKQMGGQGATRSKREPKDPQEEAEQSCYWLPDGTPGMPATAFKSAIVEASRYYDGVTMTALKRIIFVEGEGPDVLVRIIGEQHLREDTPRNSGGTADLRYRYAFSPWSAILRVRFVPQVVPAKSVINLVDAAGRGGVGDWRPGSPKSNTGIFGTFRIDDEKLEQLKVADIK
jgi:hypothetical protein